MDASAKSRLSYLLETPVLTENSVIGSTGIQGEHRYWKVISNEFSFVLLHNDDEAATTAHLLNVFLGR